MQTLSHLISSLVWIYSLMILVTVLFTWVRAPSRRVAHVREVVDNMTVPYLRLFRRFLPPFGGFDLSPLFGLIALQIVGTFAAATVARL